MNDKTTAAVILAAGSGSRMGADVTKQRLTICGKSILRLSLEAFCASSQITSVTVVTRHDEIEFATREARGLDKVKAIVVGGKTRAESAKIGFESIGSPCDFVAIHDAARCLITTDMIDKVISDAKRYGASSAATRVYDTVKIIDASGFISATPNRDFVMLASTPQIFKWELYEKALENSYDDTVTDDNMLLERSGVSVFCTDVGEKNIKITHPCDVDYAEYVLRGRMK